MRHDIHGLLVINKHAGITSARAVTLVKKFCNVKKVGHTGTLDPFATGVLVCCMNKATKLATFLLRGNKKYEAVLHLGIETDTQDGTGNVIFTSGAVTFSTDTIASAVHSFAGDIDQQPPVYSALKHKGVPLHKLARSGKAVSKPPRRVHISSIEIKKIELPLVHFDVSCSAGTYIRTLCSDIGKRLGCGGYLKELKRTESSGFAIKEAISLPELETVAASKQMPQFLTTHVVTMADALPDIPEVCAGEHLREKILNGKRLSITDIHPVNRDHRSTLVKAVGPDRHLIAVLRYERGSESYDYCCVFHG